MLGLLQGSGAGLPLTLAAIWLVCACAVPFLREPHRWPATWALIVAGVPLIGWMTLHFGPLGGVLAFAMALLMLMRPPGRGAH
ncbi:MAG: DUF2484 family protein [Paracoccus sp. (in: a-proteobacteria)]|nr:DUF2484 family protein [Paracoccus sp. (in: a-proteobacteria)]